LTPALAASPQRGLWIVAALGLVAAAVGAGYGLAVGEIEALYITLGLAGCVAVLIDFRVGTLLLVVLLPISASAVFPRGLFGITGLNPINLVLAGTLVAYVLQGRSGQPAAPLVPRALLWLYVVPIVLAGLMGMRHFDDIVPAFFERLILDYDSPAGYFRDTVVKPLLPVLAALLVGAAVARTRRPEPFVGALAIGACALAAVFFAFIVASEVRLGSLASRRAREFFAAIGTHPNELGRVFVTGYALLLFAWWETKGAARHALFAALGVLSFGIVLTFSRNAYLGFLLVNGLFLVWKFNAKKLALAVLGTALAVALAPAAVYRRMSYGFDTGADAVSAGRLEGIWLPLLPETLKSPLWGSGLDSLVWSYPMETGAMLFVGHPHNAYLEALLDMGVVGLALLLVYYAHVWRGFRALGSNPYLTPLMRGFFQGACAALVAFWLAGVTGGSLRPQPENVLLWVAIGIMYGLLPGRPAR
jgi:hypothetical protein